MHKIISLFTLLILTGCHFPSSMVLEGPGGRNAYNIEVQKTNAEEMLLNLVRLRYYDSPFFLEVSSVTSSFTFKNLAAATINIPGFNHTNPMSLGGETQWQTQPTIQYSPLEGQEFANQLMQPLDIATLQQVIYSGWDIDRVFRLAVQHFKEYHNVPQEKELDPEKHPKYQNFIKALRIMKKFQEEGILQVGIKEHRKIDEKENKEGCIEPNMTLQIAFPVDDEDSKTLADLLGEAQPKNGKYMVSIVQGFNKKGEIGVLPRSILSCMYNLSHSVDVPDKDLEENKAKTLYDETDDVKKEKQRVKKEIHSLMNIYNASLKPKDSYVCIKYRDNWFYIKDNDLYSKRTFMLLLELYNLQSGRRKTQGGPVLTLPIGVG